MARLEAARLHELRAHALLAGGHAERARAHMARSRAHFGSARAAKRARTEAEAGVEFDDTTLRAALAKHREAICAGTVVITNWRVGKVTDMSGLFRSWDTFNQRLEWDVSRVTNMRLMFQGCSAFNQPLRDGTGQGEWDVSSVVTMSLMFEGCAALNQGLRWRSERCTNFRAMFMECTSLTCTIDLDVRAVPSARWLENMLAFAGPHDVAEGPRLVLRHAPDGTLEADVVRALRREMQAHAAPQAATVCRSCSQGPAEYAPPCGHVALCETCATRPAGACPECKRPFERALKIFGRDACAICLEPIAIFALACGHSLCFACLYRWMGAKSALACPMCRAPTDGSVLRTYFGAHTIRAGARACGRGMSLSPARYAA